MIITKDYLIEEYICKNKGAGTIAIECGVSDWVILDRLNKFDIPKKQRGGYKRYFHNEDFFANWSHEMAYCLGFISADGHIWKNRPILDIGLHPKDLDVLTYIRDLVSPDVPIVYRDENCIRFTVTSQKIIDDLAKYNATNKKTYELKIDFEIPEDFLGDYTRGYFDGDGTIGITTGYLVSNICSVSPFFLEDLRKLWGNLGHLNKYGKISYWKMYKKDTIKFRNIIYKDINCFGMKRKREKLFCQ